MPAANFKLMHVKIYGAQSGSSGAWGSNTIGYGGAAGGIAEITI